MRIVLGLFLASVFLIFMAAWVIPLVIGIRKLRAGYRTAGLPITILAGAWGVVMIMLTMLGISSFLNRGTLSKPHPSQTIPSGFG